MFDQPRLIGFVLLGASVVAACSSSDSGSNTKGDAGSEDGAASSSGGGSGDGGGASTGGRSTGGASTGGGTSSSGGASGGGTANTAGGSTSTGGTGTAGAGGRGSAGAGGGTAAGPCEQLALCCPTSGIFRPSCEQYATTGTGPECSVLRGLFCGGVDGGNPVGGDAGSACADLGTCCGTLTGADRTQCEQLSSTGIGFACAAALSALCP